MNPIIVFLIQSGPEVGYKVTELAEKFGGSRDVARAVLRRAILDGDVRRWGIACRGYLYAAARRPNRAPVFKEAIHDPFGRSRIPAGAKPRTWFDV